MSTRTGPVRERVGTGTPDSRLAGEQRPDSGDACRCPEPLLSADIAVDDPEDDWCWRCRLPLQEDAT